MESKKVLENKVKIRFQDCDPFNHLNNAKYLSYFLNSREDAIIEAYDLDVYAHARETGKGWVVATNQISYLYPAMTMETVVIQNQLIRFTDKSITVEFRMYDENKKRLKAIMWSKYPYFDLKRQRPALHSDEFMELFQDALNPVDDTVFEERVKTITQRK